MYDERIISKFICFNFRIANSETLSKKRNIKTSTFHLVTSAEFQPVVMSAEFQIVTSAVFQFAISAKPRSFEWRKLRTSLEWATPFRMSSHTLVTSSTSIHVTSPTINLSPNPNSTSSPSNKNVLPCRSLAPWLLKKQKKIGASKVTSRSATWKAPKHRRSRAKNDEFSKLRKPWRLRPTWSRLRPLNKELLRGKWILGELKLLLLLSALNWSLRCLT